MLSKESPFKTKSLPSSSLFSVFQGKFPLSTSCSCMDLFGETSLLYFSTISPSSSFSKDIFARSFWRCLDPSKGIKKHYLQVVSLTSREVCNVKKIGIWLWPLATKSNINRCLRAKSLTAIKSDCTLMYIFIHKCIKLTLIIIIM